MTLEDEVLTQMRDEFNRIKTGMQAMRNIIKRYDRLKGFASIDNTIKDFIDTQCIIDKSTMTRFSDIYHVYSEHCSKHNASKVGSIAFSHALTNLGFISRRRHNYRARIGIALKEPMPELKPYSMHN